VDSQESKVADAGCRRRDKSSGDGRSVDETMGRKKEEIKENSKAEQTIRKQTREDLVPKSQRRFDSVW
jgi:hypothetical protein